MNNRRAGNRLVSPQFMRPNRPRNHTKQAPPKLGQAYGPWENDASRLPFIILPGGGMLQFDLNNLRLSDYRQMSFHYQVNSSLSIMNFMAHQAKWHIEHPDKRVVDFLTESLKNIWTQLIRSVSQAHWSGYAPGILEWDNNLQDNTTRITKVKDMIPELCQVNWQEVKLWSPPNTIPPKGYKYDGIKLWGQSFPVPPEATFWYPLLMDNGNYYGRKLLKPVYTSYFFSMLMHMYANRYYERFGEPTPIGRAPFDDELSVTVDGEVKTFSGTDLMMNVLQNLRSRGVVLLPSDKVALGNGQSEFEYTIDYLESQMRGADFERYMTRLDQEMSLGTFTPLLLQQTADVGSYKLGDLHYQMYLSTQNALNTDKADYIDWYILWPLIQVNFSKSTVPAHIIFEKQDAQRNTLIQTLLQALIAGNKVMPDLNEVGQAVGLTLKEIKQLKPPANPQQVQQQDQQNDPALKQEQNNAMKAQIVERIYSQAVNQAQAGTWEDSGTRLIVPFTKLLRAREIDPSPLIELTKYKHSYSTPEAFRERFEEELDALIESADSE